jgi:membrane protein YqaA with SNARE-associated domain
MNLVALLWGLAEATVFFIVPDVWLSGVALLSLKRGLIACLYALTGALLGGTAMYSWGLADHDYAVSIVEAVPAIDQEMMDRVSAEMRLNGTITVLLGPLSGTPYKVFAVQAPAAGIGLPGFMLVSIPARMLRFLAVTLMAHGVARVFLSGRGWRFRFATLALVWVAFYAAYLTRMPG